jgi:hypothetical protein
VLGRGVSLRSVDRLVQFFALVLSRRQFFSKRVDLLSQLQVLGLGLVQSYSFDVHRVFGLGELGV